MKNIIALSVFASGCAFRTVDDASIGEPTSVAQATPAPPPVAQSARACPRSMTTYERALFLSSAPLYSVVWATVPDGVMWYADRASGTTHRLYNGTDTVIPFGGASVNVSPFGRVILTSFKTNAVYEVFGTIAVRIAGGNGAGFSDGSVGDAQFDLPYDITFTENDFAVVHDAGNMAMREIGGGRVSTVRCTAKL